ncbi:DUF4386 family protein [Tenacibaculum sp. SG-28]|uniref:DUF4386 family protein n=1 Tax=Tenacibaculum sp. SG-28 TaxID=754426 RepID=UPI000CF54B6A|nr:DUF4386 family protein [Tenacibaculum sp. SG-28]PQJ22913.1 hypothetical protein BSU00_01045 [Tenacibaculum sp. SG-28]
MHKTRAATISGWGILIISIITCCTLYHWFPDIYNWYVEDQKELFIPKNPPLYKKMILGIVIILLGNFTVSYSLYHYFKGMQQMTALVSSICRLMYTLVVALASYYLYSNFATEDLNIAIVKHNYYLFLSTWHFGLIMYGIHLVLMSVLLQWNKNTPKLLQIVMFIMGCIYVVLYTLKLILSEIDTASVLSACIAIIMIIGEIAFSLWLLIKESK